MIRVITQRDRICTVADRWRKQYQNNDGSWRYGDDKREIYERLKDLDVETATLEDVDRITANSWVQLKCDACDENVNAVVMVGQQPGHDSNTASLCYECSKIAHDKMRHEG